LTINPIPGTGAQYSLRIAVQNYVGCIVLPFAPVWGFIFAHALRKCRFFLMGKSFVTAATDDRYKTMGYTMGF
jgi:hypothetical protein